MPMYFNIVYNNHKRRNRHSYLYSTQHLFIRTENLTYRTVEHVISCRGRDQEIIKGESKNHSSQVVK
jgi:hypothetical protein